MSDTAKPVPPSETGLQVHLMLVLLTLAALVVQFYFAGRGVFGDASFSAHRTMGNILQGVALVLLVATIVISATRNTGDIIQAVVFLVLVGAQSFVADRDHPTIAAFHPLLALVMVGLVFGILMKDRRMLTAAEPDR